VAPCSTRWSTKHWSSPLETHNTTASRGATRSCGLAVITSALFHAGRIKVIKEKGTRKSIKVNEGDLTQGEIARWPDSVNIVPPDLVSYSDDYPQLQST
jgi:hypothetical protein